MMMHLVGGCLSPNLPFNTSGSHMHTNLLKFASHNGDSSVAPVSSSGYYIKVKVVGAHWYSGGAIKQVRVAEYVYLFLYFAHVNYLAISLHFRPINTTASVNRSTPLIFFLFQNPNITENKFGWKWIKLLSNCVERKSPKAEKSRPYRWWRWWWSRWIIKIGAVFGWFKFLTVTVATFVQVIVQLHYTAELFIGTMSWLLTPIHTELLLIVL